MKLLVPLLIATPSLVQGTLAVRARRSSGDARSRSLKIGIIFNVCYLAAVGIAALVL